MSDDLNQILNAADKFQEMFIEPALKQMDQKLDEHLTKMEQQQASLIAVVAKHDMEIAAIKSNQSKFMKGAAMYASIVGVAVGAGWGWVRSHFKIL